MKQKTVYLCSDCGYESPKWFGKCPSCGAWNTMSEYKVKPESAARGTDTFQRGVSRPTCSRILTVVTRAGFTPASENWIECWAAVRCTVHSFWWAVNRASANPRCCCKCVRKCANLRESCMFRERNLSADQAARGAATYLVTRSVYSFRNRHGSNHCGNRTDGPRYPDCGLHTNGV